MIIFSIKIVELVNFDDPENVACVDVESRNR
jgi:hypothetical protein